MNNHSGSKLALVVKYVSDEIIYATNGRAIFESLDGGLSFSLTCELELTLIEKLRGISRLSRRLFRAQVHHIMPLGKSLVIFGYGHVFHFDSTNTPAKKVSKISGSRPLCIEEVDGVIYYGEYLGINKDKRPVSVFASSDCGRSWEAVYTFHGVEHVHGIFKDPYSDRMWLTTGDVREEIGLWYTDDDFTTVSYFIGGSQQTRIVQPLFTKHFVYFGSDTQWERNNLYRVHRYSKEIERLQSVGGSVFYGKKVGDILLFTTVCEPSEVNTDKNCVVWASADGENFSKVLSLKKDMLPSTLFQYGQIGFPRGSTSNGLCWLTPTSTADDGKTLVIDVSRLRK